ncbi:MAG: hypothetical protein LBI95_03010 [Holosporales bacterium]|nr:hypothetical protein [Holosporales bacterium]
MTTPDVLLKSNQHKNLEIIFDNAHILPADICFTIKARACHVPLPFISKEGYVVPQFLGARQIEAPKGIIELLDAGEILILKRFNSRDNIYDLFVYDNSEELLSVPLENLLMGKCDITETKKPILFQTGLISSALNWFRDIGNKVVSLFCSHRGQDIA